MWELTMQGEWDELEAFKGLPKPKKQFGNEAAEIVWPYVVLMQNAVQIHPFTKSIYLYYGQKQVSEQGRRSTEVAKRFAQEHMVPITFHNSQCYVESEMLVGYSDAPWIVVNCLDGKSVCVPIVGTPGANLSDDVQRVLEAVVAKAAELGSNVANPKEIQVSYNDRPLQNQYVRVDYQWMGESAEERMTHLTHWLWDPRDEDLAPKVRNRDASLLSWLNNDGGLPTSAATRVDMHREKARHRRAKVATGPQSFYNSGRRQQATSSRYGAALKR